MRALAGALLASALGASACLDTQPCVQRGTSTQLAGTASYSGSTPDLDGAWGASVVVDDFTTAQTCSGNPVEFTVRVGDACVLWAQATDDSGNAEIETPQACSLPLESGALPVTVTQGTLSMADSLDTLTLAGQVGGGGWIEWSFTAD